MCESSRKGKLVVVPEMLSYATTNMMGQVLLSRCVFVTKGLESNEFKDMVVELMTITRYFNIGDFIPSIAWMDLQGIERGMKKLHKSLDVLITKMIKEHMASTHECKGKLDFLDVVMTANPEISDSEKLTITNIKALLLFKPERFLSEKYAKIDPRGNDFELIPFGAGRRICDGSRVGIVFGEYILGTLVHSFDWKLPNGVDGLNMDEAFSLTLRMSVPLSALVHPRLAPNAYVSSAF
ncbi:hypothetical protein LWI28_006744 [Acer negundo]|uniref:Cytochrome P450 n=1 Tax=Acer negundo TaxID=4023 RepID=A0AAD5JLY6_ACENE|nr:hypothetical protein LWI28_006744 [Acer negundo]